MGSGLRLFCLVRVGAAHSSAVCPPCCLGRRRELALVLLVEGLQVRRCLSDLSVPLYGIYPLSDGWLLRLRGKAIGFDPAGLLRYCPLRDLLCAFRDKPVAARTRRVRSGRPKISVNCRSLGRSNRSDWSQRFWSDC